MNKTGFRTIQGILLLLLSQTAEAADWICTEAASIKEGNTYLVCGVASADNEGDAREQALLRAQKEFNLLCNGSLDCRGRPTSVEPLRNACENTDDGKIKCYRGLRYSFMDEGAGIFGRSAPVGVGGGRRPDTIKPFNLGVGYYQQMYDVTKAEATTADAALLTDTYSGIAGFFSTAFNHRYGININGYWLTNTTSTQQSKIGLDSQFIVGTNLNQSGFKAFLGAGGFVEQWKNGDASEDFYGGQFVFGLGYNTRTMTFDLFANMRQTRTYDNHLLGGDLTDKKSTSSGATFRLGLRF